MDSTEMVFRLVGLLRGAGARGAKNLPDVAIDLLKQWQSTGRYYHDARHLSECLYQLDRFAHLADDPAAVELAIFWHDSIYDPMAERWSNEDKSAEFFRAIAIDVSLPGNLTHKVVDIILATRYPTAAKTKDEWLMVDIDLTRLGASRTEFDEYTKQIRMEYSMLPEDAFRRGRSAILEEFLSGPVYHHQEIAKIFEFKARANLHRALADLLDNTTA